MNKRVISAVLLGVILLGFGGTSADAQRRRSRRSDVPKAVCPPNMTKLNVQPGEVLYTTSWQNNQLVTTQWFTMPDNLTICRY